VWSWENRSGKQLYRSSTTCQPDNDGNKSMEGKEVLNSSLSLCRSGILGKEGRDVISSAWILCRSAFLSTSGRWMEWISTTFGTLEAVYMVRERNTKNPIRWLQNKMRHTLIIKYSCRPAKCYSNIIMENQTTLQFLGRHGQLLITYMRHLSRSFPY